VERVKGISSWEPGRRFQIYPPKRIQLGLSVRGIVLRADCLRSQGQSTTANVSEDGQESPSQIPDSQPGSPIQWDVQSELDVASSSEPSRESQESMSVTLSPHVVPSVVVFQPATRPPRPVSLEPLGFNVIESKSSSDYTLSPDTTKYPVFTSTPKSKPLKSLLPIYVLPTWTRTNPGTPWNHVPHAGSQSRRRIPYPP
jgi:hypothetical protein